MNPIVKLTGAGIAGVAATALFVSPAAAAPHTHHHHHHHHHRSTSAPVFVQTDNPAGNTIVAYDRTSTGSLVEAGSYATGGRGGVLAGSVTDHLGSQGALTYDRAAHLLYAVNAGT